MGIITQNALMASDFVIIPTDGNYFAMKGIEKIHYIIGLLRRKLGAEVRILGYFMTKYNAGRKLDVDIRESLIETLGESVFEQPYGTTWRWERRSTMHGAFSIMHPRQTGQGITGV